MKKPRPVVMMRHDTDNDLVHAPVHRRRRNYNSTAVLRI